MRTNEILEPTVKERESTALGMACKLTRSSSKKPMNIEADTHLCKSRSLKFLSKTAKAGNFFKKAFGNKNSDFGHLISDFPVKNRLSKKVEIWQTIFVAKGGKV